MTIRALNPFGPDWYTPISERDKPEGIPRTRFKLCGLDGEQLGYVAPEMLFDESGKNFRGVTGRGVTFALQYGLVDWENFANDRGSIPFSPLNFKLIEYSLRCELATHIIAASHVSADEKKTS